MSVNQIRSTLNDLADVKIARHSQRFFKTGKGEYGDGDRFLGIRVPVLRKLVKQYSALTAKDARELLKSDYHEERLFALLLLVQLYDKGSESDRLRIYSIYLANTHYINNWDLVDSSAPLIVGRTLENKSKTELTRLAKSDNMWERRIAIISTFWFIRQNRFNETLTISRLLLKDGEDLIHKAAGWMLREVGKRDINTEKDFLNKHYKSMPRTMLRYAIEKFPERARKAYLNGTI